MVSTIGESFFEAKLKGLDYTRAPGFISITAANGLPIPCVGYLFANVVLRGVERECGIVIVKDTGAGRREKLPLLLGTNSLRLFDGMEGLYSCSQEVSAGGPWKATIKGSMPIRVDARSSRVVELTAPGACKGAVLVQQAVEVYTHKLTVTPTVCNGDRMLAKVTNMGPDDIWLPPNVVVWGCS
jgi:hypothetical protein